MMRISTRNARFQQWQALLTNRTKRQRAGEFLVQGVRPVNLALEHGWPVRSVLHTDRPLSRWAEDVVRRAEADRFQVAAELMAELAEKEEAEVLLVVELPPDDLDRIAVGSDFLGVVLDRPSNPGNIGSIIRSADAFGASGLIVTGHAADAYDPRAVRASTGSLFALPAVRVPTHRDVLDWIAKQDVPIVAVGTDESGDPDVFDFDLTQPTLLAIGNETTGLSAAWREAVDYLVRIPMTGSASSLNAANAATAVLYEAMRQRVSGRK